MVLERCTLRWAKLTEHAFAPTKGSAFAAGFDLKRQGRSFIRSTYHTCNSPTINSFSAYEYKIPARGKQVVLTDIQIELPTGCYGRLAPRSGLAAKNFIDVGAGVIDEDYRGNVGVVIFNHADEIFEVKKGERIAQLICERIFYPEIEEASTLSATERGDGGFGSTGKQ